MEDLIPILLCAVCVLLTIICIHLMFVNISLRRIDGKI